MIDIRKAGLFNLAGHSINLMGYGAMQLAGPGVFGPPKDHAMAARHSVHRTGRSFTTACPNLL